MKQIKILLLCFGGFSTSLLIKRLAKHLQPHGYEVTANADPIDKGMKEVQEYDIVLIAPQVKFIAEPLQKEAEKFDIPVLFIPMQEYAIDNPKTLIQNIVDTLQARGK